jgi:hypothetical protein
MRSSKSPAEFFQKMKKKPALQAVLDDIKNYTPEKIEELTGSHFPRWIKDELLELQKRGGKTTDNAAQSIADQMNEYAAKRLAEKSNK